jgi:phenylacetate-CoA ligase
VTTFHAEQRLRALAALQAFQETSLGDRLERPLSAPPERPALALFQSVAATVPAYRAFLEEHGIDPPFVRTFADFQGLPPVTKENYLLRHPLSDLCRNGRLEACDMIAVSSGSTGKPCFWPRFLSDELNVAWRFEQVFHDSFQADRRRTLVVVCFTLGTWVGGMYTASCCRHLAAKGYPLTVVTPGSNREEIFRALQELGPLYEQVVLCGYPPFLKGIVDEGLARGVEWKRYGIRMVMAGEVFSEEWRSLVAERAGSENPAYDFATLYGTADAGVLGNETPLSITIRRWLAAHPDAARQLFGESRLPTLVQYDPLSRFFETQDDHLLFTGDNGIPLVRYNILDTGGVVPFAEMLAFLRGGGFDPVSSSPPVRRLPFVYVFGRSDFTVSYFGANIYPENVTVGLEQSDIKEWVTGKFVLQVKEDDDRNRFLSVLIELAPGQQADDARRQHVAESIRAHLLRLNSEFAHYVPAECRLPRVAFAPTGDPDYFPVGVKHRYTRK